MDYTEAETQWEYEDRRYRHDFEVALDAAREGEDADLRSLLRTQRGREVARDVLAVLRRSDLGDRRRLLFQLLTEAETVAGEGD